MNNLIGDKINNNIINNGILSSFIIILKVNILRKQNE